MSIWTHINGNIILEEIAFNSPSFQPISIGNEAQFEDDEDIWNQCNIPSGSEGSLYLRYSETFKTKSQRYTNITITGSLRNFSYKNQKDTIINWLNNLKLPSNSFIRDGIISIEFEDEAKHVYHYDINEKWIEFIKEKNDN